MIVLLDCGPLAKITHPRAKSENKEAKQWLARLLSQGTEVLVPEISDYELRRKLLHIKSMNALRRLDQLKWDIGYLTITTEMMLKAAELWARARQRGQQTAPPDALDGDMILAAQALVFAAQRREEIVIATENVKHLSLFAEARLWRDIEP